MSHDTDTPTLQTNARLAGVLWILTFVFSIPALLLYTPVLDDPASALGGGADAQVRLGAFLEVLLVIANAGTAIVMFPVLKRWSESLALGYVAVRIFESTMIGIGLVSMLGVLQANSVAGVDSLVAVHDATFLLGPAFCAGFGNGILLGYLMYRSGLVPRRMAIIGLVGGALALVTATAVLFGAWEQTSPAGFFLTLPEAVWEASLGVYLLIWGYRSPSARPAPAPRATPEVAPAL